MEKVAKIHSLHDHQTDYEYWQTKSPQERLDAIEFLREQYINFTFDVKPRFQRVCSIINRKQS